MAIREDLESWSKIPFPSQAALIQAMRDPQYKDPRNDAYRQAVEAKMIISTETGTSTTVYDTVQQQNESGLGETETEASKQRAEEQRQAEEALCGSHGAMAVSPQARGRIQPSLESYGLQQRDE